MERFTVAAFLFMISLLEFTVETNAAAVDTALNVVTAFITAAVKAFLALVITLIECKHGVVAYVSSHLFSFRSYR